MTQPWTLSWAFDPYVARLADRHYSRRASSVGSNQFAPPGRKLVLRADGPAAWVSMWPDPRYVDHDYPHAWVCTLFRREGGDVLASDLIRAAVAATRWKWGAAPTAGMVTFVNPAKVRAKRDPGYCFLRAGFRRLGVTGGGLTVLGLCAAAMPDPVAPLGAQLELAQ
jgi:hypothetical protein